MKTQIQIHVLRYFFLIGGHFHFFLESAGTPSTSRRQSRGREAGGSACGIRKAQGVVPSDRRDTAIRTGLSSARCASDPGVRLSQAPPWEPGAQYRQGQAVPEALLLLGSCP